MWSMVNISMHSYFILAPFAPRWTLKTYEKTSMLKLHFVGWLPFLSRFAAYKI